MRVLVANIPLPNNRFLQDLNDALSRLCVLVQSSDDFWNMNGSYDIVHLHFPEYLTYEIEAAYATGLTQSLIEQVEERLKYWSSRARIVITRHNLMPHLARDDDAWAQLYRLVYSYADAVVHLARASLNEFRARYKDLAFRRGVEPAFAVVPIHSYSSLPNAVGRRDARRRLGIPDDATVILVFGAIRSRSERDLIERAFRRLKVRRKVLLVSHWREELTDVAWIRLKYWIRDLKRLYHSVHPQHAFNYGFVEESEAQLYLNAADVLFVARIGSLSSANVSLGFTFGRVVVGPDQLNPGELLRDAGNPVFDPSDMESVTRALDAGVRAAREGKLGSANLEIARTSWDVARCASAYVQLFNKLVSGTEASQMMAAAKK